MTSKGLSGRYRVRALRAAFEDVGRLMQRTRDRIELRRHALKLRYWPDPHPTDEAGMVLDLDWCWVRALAGLKVGELRIVDEIGGHDNLRVFFFVGERAAAEEMPIIWIVRVIQKKRDDLSTHDLAILKARRRLVMERFYKA